MQVVKKGLVKEIQASDLLQEELDRFFSKVNKRASNGCWGWTAGLTHYGYGQFSLYRLLGYTPITAHRLSYIIHKGRIPEGLVICHKCDNRKCINPDHLFLGTQADNIEDMHKKGRASGGSSPGAKNPAAILTEEQVLEIVGLFGKQSQVSIAKAYGVSPNTISAIKTGKTWSSVTSIGIRE